MRTHAKFRVLLLPIFGALASCGGGGDSGGSGGNGGGFNVGGGGGSTTWQAGVFQPSTNFGWMVIGNENATRTAKEIESRESPSASTRPTLAIDYLPH